MKKLNVEITDETHIKLLEVQLERKRNKEEPTAINKIAAELLKEALNKKA